MRFLSNLLASTLGALLAVGILFFFFLIFLLAVAAATEQTVGVRDGSVLVLELAGDIPELVADDPFARAFGDAPPYDLRDVTASLRKAAVDDRIGGLWIQVKDVSSSWATLQEVRTAIQEFKASGKPVVASADDYMMAEAEYYVASAADAVFASRESMFEFNGFVLTVQFYKNLLDKLEVEPQVVRVGDFKSAVEPFLRTDLSPENEEQLGDLLSTQNDAFLKAVAASRKIPVDALQRMVESAPILTAQAAFEAQLLDSLLYRDEVVDLLKRQLDYDAGDDLRTVELRDYARTSVDAPGLEPTERGEVAVVYAEGMIVSGRSDEVDFGQRVIGAETLVEAMEQARDDDDVRAVVLRVNSPGGSPSASDAMWRAISLTAEQKPVVVSMGGVAASGGYWIATAADTIVTDPLTITGSIGVFYTLFDASGLFENKLGITFDQVATSPYADLFSLVDELSPQERQLIQRAADETYQTFLRRVADGRGLTVEQVHESGQGRVWTGARAVELGLADVLGDLETAVGVAAKMAGMAEGPYRTRVLPRPKTFIERLGRSLNARAAHLWMSVGTTPAERAVLEQIRSVRGLLRDHGTIQARLPLTLTID